VPDHHPALDVTVTRRHPIGLHSDGTKPAGHESGESTVDLVFFEGCPNVDQTRANLRDALERTGRAGAWNEWDLRSPLTPERMRHLASPSILVNGRDVTGIGTDGHGKSNPTGMACRVDGAPSIDVILAALSTF
jgi:hypothetical protein